MASTAFAPAHLTGIFRIFPSTSGGAGLTLKDGMRTMVRSAKTKNTIRINGSPSPAPVSRFVLSKFKKFLPSRVSISHRTRIRIGCGLGMSAAGALSLALALNDFCRSPLTRAQCVKIAHDADVACGTGLASVDVQAIGGLVFRKGANGAPIVRKFSPAALRTPVHLFIYGPIRTASIIRAKGWKGKVNSASLAPLSAFCNSPSLNSLAGASNTFANASGLGKWSGNFLCAHPNFGMAMLGKTLFIISKKPVRAPKISGLPSPLHIRTFPSNASARLL